MWTHEFWMGFGYAWLLYVLLCLAGVICVWGGQRVKRQAEFYDALNKRINDAIAGSKKATDAAEMIANKSDEYLHYKLKQVDGAMEAAAKKHYRLLERVEVIEAKLGARRD